MVIKWQNWLIESHRNGYGYVTKRRLGKTARWRADGYHATLSEAAKCLFEERVRTETTDHSINAMDTASARVCGAELIAEINRIAQEIAEGIDYAA